MASEHTLYAISCGNRLDDQNSLNFHTKREINGEMKFFEWHFDRVMDGYSRLKCRQKETNSSGKKPADKKSASKNVCGASICLSHPLLPVKIVDKKKGHITRAFDCDLSMLMQIENYGGLFHKHSKVCRGNFSNFELK